MILIVCVDDKLGLSFGNQRQSRDRELTKRILAKVGKMPAWTNGYTAKMLFSGDDNNRPSNWSLSEEPFRMATRGEVCFMEAMPAQEIRDAMDAGSIEAIWMYFWNRIYPSDNQFPLDMNERQWGKVSEAEFEGYSHPVMLEVVYEKR